MNIVAKKKNLQQFIKRGVFLKIVDLCIVIIGIVLTAFLFNLNYLNAYETNLWLWILTFSFYFLIFGEIFELYQLSKSQDFYFTFRNIILTAVFTSMAYISTPLITPELPQSRIEILIFFISILGPLLIWRIIYIKFFFHPIFLKKILIVGNENETNALVKITSKHSNDYVIVGYVSKHKITALDDKMKWFSIEDVNLIEIVKREKISIIVICGKSIKEFFEQFRNSLLKIVEKGIMVISNNEYTEQLTKQISKNRLNDSFYNYFTYSKYNKDAVYLGFIKIFDVFLAVIGLLFIIMIIPLIYVINLFFNKGPLFYSQKRVGKNGMVFKIYKLRTMIVGAEKGLPLWATKDDLRITPFGKILRKTRIDELPQFYNVLVGDMNVIGPRPERPEFVSMLEEKIPFYSLRHIIKPGLTGWAQVEYPYANTVEDQEMKLRYDLYYLKERNLLLDFKIVLKTINTVLFYKGY